jgi:pyrroloquinoline-quinone synthase
LSGVTVLDDFIIGVAVMGMIERMFSEISSWIGQGVLARGWLSEDQMIHYKLHANLDVKHAQDFFRVVADSYAKSDENRYLIEQGLRMGATLFDGLYAGLWKSRSRRWRLPQAFPSSMTASYVP